MERSFLNDGACYAIRFKSKEVPLNVDIPRGSKVKTPYPVTSHGFTAGIKGRIGVPEFTVKKGAKISIKDGAEIWKITRDGRQTLYAVFENKTFKIVEQ